jgi:hypothetical protein
MKPSIRRFNWRPYPGRSVSAGTESRQSACTPRARRFGRLTYGAIAFMAFAIGGCSSHPDYANRTFFRNEVGLETHGRKTWFDHLVEVDPGGIKTEIAPNYDQVAPERIAILPFIDRGSANYVVDKIQLTRRSPEEQADWAWTDANRVRRAVNGYMSQREFLVANLLQVDAILRQHGVDSAEKLSHVPPATLGKWLGVDAVMYGEVTNYEAYYLALVSAWQVGVHVEMVSTRDANPVFAAKGSRWAVDLRLAFDPMGILVNSGLSLLELRDVTLARAEEETAREVVLRIPRSEQLKSRLIEEASSGQIEFATAPASSMQPAMQAAKYQQLPATAPVDSSQPAMQAAKYQQLPDWGM